MNIFPGIFKRLAKPKGLVLKGDEARMTITKWEGEVRSIASDEYRIGEVVPKMKLRLTEIDENVKGAVSELKEARDRFREVKTPVAKRRWARRLVYATRTLEYLHNSKQLMKLNVERAEASIEDAKIIGRLIGEKVRDAKLYYELNGELRLVGEMLAAAEQIHDRTRGMEKEVEVSVEGLESLIQKMDDKKLMAEAERIAK